MQAAIWALILALAALLLSSAFFSASETAFSSLNHIRMKSRAADGDKKAARTLALADDYDKLLSSVLVGNNIVNILSSSLATVLFVGWFGNLGVTISTIVMTVLVLIVGEITPKTIAKQQPEKFAIAVTPVLRVIMVVLTPVNAFFSAWKRLVMRVLRLDGESHITEQELLTYVEEVREDGTISEREEDLIRSVIEFDDVQAIEICTPRVDVTAVAVGEEPGKVAAVFHETGYSRLPVYRDTIDSILGVVLEKDFHYYVEGMGQTLEQVIRPALYITKSMKISRLLPELQQKRTHMAVIVDEYGGTLGIVTIEDVLEELVGEIWDEHDEIEQETEQLPDGRWRVSGGTDVEELFRLFGEKPPETEAITVGGWVLEQLGRIPKAGQTLEGGGLHLTVEAMRRNRVDTVLAEMRQPEADED